MCTLRSGGSKFMDEFVAALREEEKRIGFVLSDTQVVTLTDHYARMVRWNRRLNLTRITAPAEAAARHYGESLFLAAKLPDGAQTIADIGSGAGFPGVVVAVARPDLEVTLVESDQRKAVFLRECTLRLPNVRVEVVRLEQLSGFWDCFASRAVRWPDLGRAAPGRTKGLALLTSLADLQEITSTVGFTWNKAIPLPGSKSGVLLIGSVSRGTHG
jgi:16S rRNA (guanine527-N7)-methyltransferase